MVFLCWRGGVVWQVWGSMAIRAGRGLGSPEGPPIRALGVGHGAKGRGRCRLSQSTTAPRTRTYVGHMTPTKRDRVGGTNGPPARGKHEWAKIFFAVDVAFAVSVVWYNTRRYGSQRIPCVVVGSTAGGVAPQQSRNRSTDQGGSRKGVR